MPFGNATPSATCRASPSGLTTATIQGPSKPNPPFTYALPRASTTTSLTPPVPVGVPGGCDDVLVEPRAREPAQVGIQRAALEQQPPLLPGHDQQPAPVLAGGLATASLGQPVDRERDRRVH